MFLVELFQSYGTAIQAFCSIVLILVTIIYVRATFRLVHTAQVAYVKPVCFVEEDDKTVITLKNLGPGVAINVKLFLEPEVRNYPQKKEEEIYVDDAVDIFYHNKKDEFISTQKGSFDIKPIEQTTFVFEGKIKTNSEMVIFWETITGEKLIKLFHVQLLHNGTIDILALNNYGMRKWRNLLLRFGCFILKKSGHVNIMEPDISLKEFKEMKKKD